MLARYTVGMAYGIQIDTAILPLPLGPVRTNLSCTIFLSEPYEYVGGALRIVLGDRSVSFKEPPGTVVIYPSTTLHEVEKVTEGERLVGLTFVQSRIGDVERRMLMYELNEIAALEGLSMRLENFPRLQGIQANLMRRWADAP